ncbi:hypothetical protein [Streptomyces erythrochromogenes]|uniref:hypothetical protein n=1 Tax=Streptomyces erythrochromogenes TaxID=285574 RepID=UPI0037D859B1
MPETHQVHDGRGRFTATLNAAEKAAEAARLRSRGLTYQQIADEVGYTNKGTAYEAVQRVLKEAVTEAGEEVKAVELERLDMMWQAALKVMEARHWTVSQGKVVSLNNAPLPDDGPVLQAIDRLLRIQERRAKLLGLDTATRVSIDAENLGAEIGALLDRFTPKPAADDDDA